MPVRTHNDQHEVAERLPLVSGSATVTAFRPLDHNRNDEVERAVVSALRTLDATEWARWRDGDPVVDWRRVDRFLERPGDDPDVTVDGPAERVAADALETLRERHERPYPSLASVRIDADVDFAAGQYVTLRYRGVPRPYSVASPPARDHLELCLKRVPGGRLTGRLFESLAAGETVTVRGPNGHLTLGEPSERDLAFLATGTGVAPFRSMIEHVYETDRHRHGGGERDVWLFLGAAWADDLPYRERFRALDRERDGFHFVPTLSRERLLTDWTGETDYVQETLLKYVDTDAVARSAVDLPSGLAGFLGSDPVEPVDARLDPGALDVYACGTNRMVASLVAAATGVGVPDHRVEAEGYG